VLVEQHGAVAEGARRDVALERAQDGCLLPRGRAQLPAEREDTGAREQAGPAAHSEQAERVAPRHPGAGVFHDDLLFFENVRAEDPGGKGSVVPVGENALGWWEEDHR
jgi:hypothetical protein